MNIKISKKYGRIVSKFFGRIVNENFLFEVNLIGLLNKIIIKINRNDHNEKKLKLIAPKESSVVAGKYSRLEHIDKNKLSILYLLTRKVNPINNVINIEKKYELSVKSFENPW